LKCIAYKKKKPFPVAYTNIFASRSTESLIRIGSLQKLIPCIAQFSLHCASWHLSS